MALDNQGGLGSVHHHEAFSNGSLILTTEDDRLREERRYRRLLDRTSLLSETAAVRARVTVGGRRQC
jgi:hypothetical protein